MNENSFGIRPHFKKWEARTRLFGKYYSLGLYPEAYTAAKVYDNAVFWLGKHGRQKAKLNFPEDYATEEACARRRPLERTVALLNLFGEK
jgi:hypothetical protein